MSENLKNRATIKHVNELLAEKNLNIPEYQRPYKWSKRNILELLSDIDNAIENAKKYKGFKYRIGTIILHENNGNQNDIVDGQQRIISLVLLKRFLDKEYKSPFKDKKFNNKDSKYNIYHNYQCIKDWFDSRSDETKKEFIDAFSNIIEVVVISVTKLSEAFQLFDSQNSRGKKLDPHDLLKAYHLREMKNESKYEIERAVVLWESRKSHEIHTLFDKYLFPIWNWVRGNKSGSFTINDIGCYKGISQSLNYSYVKRAIRAMPYYQLLEPFISGKDFFQLVDHYLNLKEDIEQELDNVKLNGVKICDIINAPNHYGSGFEYAKNLFYCAMLFYYDKFHNLDSTVIKKLFAWAFMLRVDMMAIGFDTINKYSLGDTNSNYTNHIAIFSLIKNASLHSEIADIAINLKRTDDKARSDKWQALYDILLNK